MNSEIFKKAGLTGVQAEILDFLLTNGASKASLIAKKTSRPRGVVYKGLEELLDLSLIEKKEKPNQIAKFIAEHPAKIEAIFDKREKELKHDKQSFHEQLPDLISLYNLANNKPGVKFYEGEEGISLSLLDTLKSKTEIYTFADVEAIEGHLKEVNAEYVKKRQGMKVKKKIIVADTDYNRKFFFGYDQSSTQVKFIKKEFYKFYSGMQIYDNKISYQTLEKENMISVIIEDKHIYQMNKLLFEYIWNSLN